MESNPIIQGHWELMKQLLHDEQIQGVITDLNKLEDVWALVRTWNNSLFIYDLGVLLPLRLTFLLLNNYILHNIILLAFMCLSNT
ncbi:hypothetical protein C2G38_2094871 [Gigaspora rosea]|uniref:Uncharacterized protein n=1 Tax=Gigaspora rosea TaxID=44941 RepID=A0A397UX26_9GLOM|nr:hypothetical protein C2G38_2094871 [Gigaspora rosea]